MKLNNNIQFLYMFWTEFQLCAMPITYASGDGVNTMENVILTKNRANLFAFLCHYI